MDNPSPFNQVFKVLKTPKTLVHEACAKEKLNDRWNHNKSMKSPPTFNCKCHITNSNGEEYIAVSDGFSTKKAAENDAALKVILDIQQKIISPWQTIKMREEVSNNELHTQNTSKRSIENALDSAISDTEDNMIFGDPVKELLDFCKINNCGPPQYTEDVIKGCGNTNRFTVTCTTTPPTHSAAATKLRKKLAKRVAAFRLLQTLKKLPDCNLNLEEVTSENLNDSRKDESIADNTDKNYIGHYQIEFDHVNCLGRGGFGVVFEAKKKIDDITYAVKRIKFPCREKTRKKVLREVKALASLDHPHIVRYYNAWIESPPEDWLEANSKAWEQTSVHEETLETGYTNSTHTLSSFQDLYTKISATVTPCTSGSTKQKDKDLKRSPYHNVMYLFIQQELCQKQTLETWIRDVRDRETSLVLAIFLQIVEAVEYVHLQKLIHRDLKPSNIFFAQMKSSDGNPPTVKIGDFGLVVLAHDELEYKTSECPTFVSSVITGGDVPKMKLTRNVGTRMYMSPEQFRESSYNYKVDIYALGLIFFELLMPMCTEAERYEKLSEIRMLNFPVSLIEKHEAESKLVMQMTSHSPTERPDASTVKAWMTR